MNFQQYAGHAVNYAGYFYNAAKQWWWPSQQIPNTPVQRLKFYLDSSKIQFKTKHTQNKIVVERLCMMYNELITSDNKKYSKFIPTIEKPVEYVQSTVETSDFVQQKGQLKQQRQSVVSIIGQLKIKANKVNCSLLITLTFHSDIEQQLPFVYVRNPDPQKTQSNQQFTNKQPIYESIMGGITLSNSQKQKLKVQWSQYKSTNLLNLVKSIQNILYTKFPFVKRYLPLHKLQIGSQDYKKIQNFRKQLHEALQKSQQLVILKQSIESEQQHLKKENKKLLNLLATGLQYIQKLDNNLFDNFRAQQNQQLLQLLCIKHASFDCLRYVENSIQNLQKSDNKYDEYVLAVKQWSTKLFQARWKLKQKMEYQQDYSENN